MKNSNNSRRNVNNIYNTYLTPNSSSNSRNEAVSISITSTPNYHSIQPYNSSTPYSQSQNSVINIQRSASNSQGQLSDASGQNNESQLAASSDYYESQTVSGNQRSGPNVNNLPCPIQNIQTLISNYPMENERTESRTYNLRSRPRQRSVPPRAGSRRSQRINRSLPPNVTVTSDMSIPSDKYQQSRQSYYGYQNPAPNSSMPQSSMSNECVGLNSTGHYVNLQSTFNYNTPQSSMGSYCAQINGLNSSGHYTSHQSTALDLTSQSSATSYYAQNNTDGQFGAQNVAKDNENGTILNRQTSQSTHDSNRLGFQTVNNSQSTNTYPYSVSQSINRGEPLYQNISGISMYEANRLVTSNRTEPSINTEQGRLLKQYTSEEIGICQTMLSLRGCPDNRSHREINPYQMDTNNEINMTTPNNVSRQNQIYGHQSSERVDSPTTLWQGFLKGPSNSNYMCRPLDLPNLLPPTVPFIYEQSSMNSFVHPQNVNIATKKPRGRQRKEKSYDVPDETPTKRTRTTFDPQTQLVLEQYFQENPYISKDDRDKLSKKLLVNEKKIKIWYQNRRMRERRKNLNLEGTVGEMMRKRKRRGGNKSLTPPGEIESQQTTPRRGEKSDSTRLPGSDVSTPHYEPNNQGRQSESSFESDPMCSGTSYNSVNNSQVAGTSDQRWPADRLDSFDNLSSQIIQSHDNILVSPTSARSRSSINEESKRMGHQMSQNYHDLTFFASPEPNSHVNNPLLPTSGPSSARTNPFTHVSPHEWDRSAHAHSTGLSDCSDYKNGTPNPAPEYQSDYVYRSDPMDVRHYLSSNNTCLSNGGSVTVNSPIILPHVNSLEKDNLVTNEKSTVSRDHQFNAFANNAQQSVNASHFSEEFPSFMTAISMQGQQDQTTTYESETQKYNSSSNLFEDEDELAVPFNSTEMHQNFQISENNQFSNFVRNSSSSHSSHSTIPLPVPQIAPNHSNFASYPELSMSEEPSLSDSKVIAQHESCLTNEKSPSANLELQATGMNLVNSTFNSSENFPVSYNESCEDLSQDIFNSHKRLQQLSTQFAVPNNVRNSSTPINYIYNRMEKTGVSQNQLQLSNLYGNRDSSMQNFYHREMQVDDTLSNGHLGKKNQQASGHNPITHEIRTALLAANNLNNQMTETPQTGFGLSDVYQYVNQSIQNNESLPSRASQNERVNLSTSGADNSLTKPADVNDNSLTFKRETVCKRESSDSNQNSLNSSVSDLFNEKTLENIFSSKEAITSTSVSNQNSSYITNNDDAFATSKSQDDSVSNAAEQLKQIDTVPMPDVLDDEISILLYKPPTHKRHFNSRYSTRIKQENSDDPIPSSSTAVYPVPSSSFSSETNETESRISSAQGLAGVKIKSEKTTTTFDETLNDLDDLREAYNGDLNNSITFQEEDCQSETVGHSNRISNTGSNALQKKDDHFSYQGVVIKKEPEDSYLPRRSSSVTYKNPFQLSDSAQTASSDTSANLECSFVSDTSSASASCSQEKGNPLSAPRSNQASTADSNYPQTSASSAGNMDSSFFEDLNNIFNSDEIWIS